MPPFARRLRCAVASIALLSAVGCAEQVKVDILEEVAVERLDALEETLPALAELASRDADPGSPREILSLPPADEALTQRDLSAALDSPMIGEGSRDLDRDGSMEDVTVLIGAAALDRFVFWSGDIASEDEGLCYLGFEVEEGVAFQLFGCETPGDSVVCRRQAGVLACGACNSEGRCRDCLLEVERACRPPL